MTHQSFFKPDRTELPIQRWRDAVHERAGHRCQIRFDEKCTGRSSHAHHILLKRHGGLNTEANGLAACAHCHHELHAHPALSYQVGWLRRQFPKPGDYFFEPEAE